MKPPPFLYVRPRSLEEALQVLTRYAGGAAILAGGQSLIPLLNFRLARPEVLVDVAQVEELQAVEVFGGSISVGAMVRQAVAESHLIVRDRCPLVPRVLRHVGHSQIRNQGTIGGSIAHADPAAELPTAAVALNATIVAASIRGKRQISADDFYLAPLTNALAEDELVTEVRFPATDGTPVAFLEVTRRAHDFALAGVAAVASLRDSGEIDTLRMVALGVGGTPLRLHQAEAAIAERRLTREAIGEAGRAGRDEVEGFSNVHADADYRRRLVGVLVRRTLMEILDGYCRTES